MTSYQRPFPDRCVGRLGDSINEIVRLLNGFYEKPVQQKEMVEEVYEIDHQTVVELMHTPMVIGGRWHKKIVTHFDLAEDMVLCKSDIQLWSEYNLNSRCTTWYLKYPVTQHYIQPWTMYNTIIGDQNIAAFLANYGFCTYDAIMNRMAGGSLFSMARMICCTKQLSTSVTLEIARWSTDTHSTRCRCVIIWSGRDLDELCSIGCISNLIASPSIRNFVAMLADSRFDLYQQLEQCITRHTTMPNEHVVHVTLHNELYDSCLSWVFK